MVTESLLAHVQPVRSQDDPRCVTNMFFVDRVCVVGNGKSCMRRWKWLCGKSCLETV